MNLTKVTITGADDKVDQIKLLELTDKYPFVEWGILFSSNKEGNQRYPSEAWRNFLYELGLPLSAHLCGSYAKEVLEKKNFDLILKLNQNYQRLQLNYNFQRSKGWDLITLFKYAEGSIWVGIKIDIILQYNKSNSQTLDLFMDSGDIPPNIHFLYDSSGGRGVKIAIPPPKPFNDYFTGYSGGIEIQDLNTLIPAIKVIESNNNFWIDLETGARTDNEFDIVKVEAILEQCAKFITI